MRPTVFLAALGAVVVAAACAQETAQPTRPRGTPMNGRSEPAPPAVAASMPSVLLQRTARIEDGSVELSEQESQRLLALLARPK